MFQAVRLIKKCTLIVPAIALWSCGAISQPATPSPSPDGKAIAERLIKPNNGVAALVFDEKGRAVLVNKEGQRVQACQACTPELERRYGPQCAKAPKASEQTYASKPAEITPICNKLMGTNVQGVNPISVLRHTGSECMTFFFDNGGSAEAFQICW